MSGLSRRALLLAAGAAALWPGSARGLGRTPLGGRLSFAVPWSLGSVDPHDLTDAGGALFGGALFDTLFVPDPKLGLRPALAESMPTQEPYGTAVRLRPGLRSAAGKGLDARDVIASIQRARALGGAAALHALGEVSGHPKEPLTVVMRGAALSSARALSSPVAAITPRGFDPARPDGTGPFAATRSSGTLTLRRNAHASTGASFLDEIVVEQAADLKQSLRDFEAGRHDLGWLGSGLFGSRSGSVKFDLGAVGLLVVAATRESGTIAKAGALQRLLDLLPKARLGHLNLGALPEGSDSVAWDDTPIDVYADAASAHLVEVAKALSDVLSRPGHEVRVRRASASEILAKRRRGEPMLSCHALRPVAPGVAGEAISLATLDDPSRAPDVAAKPPAGASAREVARSLRVGVLGELRLSGAIMPTWHLARARGSGWDLGASSRRRAKP